MFKRSVRCLAGVALLAVGPRVAEAQWAVVDAPAIAQLIQQVKAMEEAVQITRDQLAQAKLSLQAMTGNRGMELLQGGLPRNYLPSSGAQLEDVLQGGSAGFPGLSLAVRSAIGRNALLTSRQLSALSSGDQQQIADARAASALQQALAEEALVNSSGRFASVQSLIAAIPRAADQKGILDLQARISAELGMLQNEQTKLLILQQATQAQATVNGQRQRERVIAGHGQFASRFQPSFAVSAR